MAEKSEKSAAPQGLCAKAKLVFTNITVEPILTCYILPCVMTSLATQNLSLEKACRVNLALSTEKCDALISQNSSGYNASEEVAVQSLVATMNAFKNIVQSVVPSLLMLFLGSWSDRHQRRKPCFLLPIVGDMLACLGLLLSTYYFYEWPLEVTSFLEAVPPSITGGWFVMFMAVFSYISGITGVKTRTVRIGAVNLFANISITIGIALSGIFYNKLGFYGVYSIALSMYFMGLVYGVLYVKDIPQTLTEKPKSEASFFRDFFDLKHVKDTLKVAFKEGPKNRKQRICTIMVLVMVIIGPTHGELNVLYLFVRFRFQWNEIDYSIYSAFHFILHVTGTLFSLLFFTKFLKVDDAVLGLVSSLSKIAAGVCYAFAPNIYYFYLGAVLECLNGTSFIAMRSIMSKLVPTEELGKLNSLFGVCEALMPLIYGPMYSTVYKTTIHYFPGAFFLVGGLLTTPAVVIYIWLYREHLRDKKEDMKAKQEKEDLNLLPRKDTNCA